MCSVLQYDSTLPIKRLWVSGTSSLVETHNTFFGIFHASCNFKSLQRYASQGQFHKSWAHGANIEIALLKLGARRKARSTPVKSFSKVGRKVQIGRKTVYEIDTQTLGTSGVNLIKLGAWLKAYPPNFEKLFVA